MKKPARYLLLFTLGFLIGAELYSRAFDPLNFLRSANVLAANSYLNGCLYERDKSKTPECKKKAKNWLDMLDEITK